MFGGAMVASEEDAPIMEKLLGLTPEQTADAKALLESYSAQMQRQTRRSDRLEETAHMNSQGWHDPAFEMARRKVAADNKRVAIELERELIQDLQSLLTNEQLDKWELFSISRRMRYMLPQIGRPLAGAMLSNDLRDLVRKDIAKKKAAEAEAKRKAAEEERKRLEEQKAQEGQEGQEGQEQQDTKAEDSQTKDGASSTSTTPTESTDTSGDVTSESTAPEITERQSDAESNELPEESQEGKSEDESKDVLDGELLTLAQQYEAEISNTLAARGNLTLQYNQWDWEERVRPVEEQSRRFEAVRDADKRLFDLQSKYVQLFSHSLSAELRPLWEKRIRKNYFGFAYSDSKRLVRLREFARIEGLSPEQLIVIKDVTSQTEARVFEIQDAFFADWKRREFRRTFTEEDSGQNYADYDAFRKRRREVEEPALTRLLALLTPNQRRAYHDGDLKEKKGGDGEDHDEGWGD